MRVLTGGKVNPLIGAAGISTFPTVAAQVRIIFLTYQRILNIDRTLKNIVVTNNLLEEVHEKQNQ
jgi:Na+-transporting methylmalonyl-CoA/oxaloacetate decarboxylase beta subunit